MAVNDTMDKYHEFFDDYSKSPVVNLVVDDKDLSDDMRALFINNVICETSVGREAGFCSFDVTGGFLFYEPVATEAHPKEGVQEIIKDQGISVLDTFQPGKKLELQLGYAIGQPPVETKSGDSDKSRQANFATVFIGYITKVDLMLDGGKKVNLKVECMDAKELMMHNFTNKNFEQIGGTDEIQVVSNILESYDKLASYKSSDTKFKLPENSTKDFTINMLYESCSDYDLICKIADKYDLLFFVSLGKMIFDKYPTIDTDLLPVKQEENSILFHPYPGSGSKAEDVATFEISASKFASFTKTVDWHGQILKVNVIGMPSSGKQGLSPDPSSETPGYIVGEAQYSDAGDFGGGTNPVVDALSDSTIKTDYVNEAKKKTSGDGKNQPKVMDMTVNIVDNSANSKDLADMRAKVEMDKLVRESVKGSFVIRNPLPSIRPGKKVKIVGLFQDKENTYLITKVKHEMSTKSYTMTCEFRGSRI